MNIRIGTVTGIVFLFILLEVASVMAQVPAPQLWKARALQAAENMQALEKKLNLMRDNWNSPEANAMKCEAMLETAFGLHLAHESTVHKVGSDGKHISGCEFCKYS